MINYIEKGIGLHEHLARNNLQIVQRGYEWFFDGVSGDDESKHDEINSMISSYDPLIVLKKEKKLEILEDSESIMNAAILKNYPRFEVDTWQNQKSDAESYLKDNNAITITLDALASQRGVSKQETAEKIVNKAAQFAAFSAKYAGERQRLEDLIDSATTIEQLNNIRFIPI